jgi:hypothetical protein
MGSAPNNKTCSCSDVYEPNIFNKYTKACEELIFLNDLINNHDELLLDQLFLISANSIPNYLQAIEESKVLLSNNNETKNLLNNKLSNYILENFEIYDDYETCKLFSNNNNNEQNDKNKFIIVESKFMSLNNYEEDIKGKSVNIRLIKNNKKKILECEFKNKSKLYLENIKTHRENNIYYKFIEYNPMNPISSIEKNT